MQNMQNRSKQSKPGSVVPLAMFNIFRAVEAFRDVGPKLVRQLVAIYR